MQDSNERFSILIVDDNNENRRIIAMVLSSNKELDLTLVSNGAAAVSFSRKNIPDLILLDIMMPGMDGYEVARRLKEDESTRDIPILFVTANTDEESISRGFKCGGVDYITKPFNRDELLARVNVQIRLKKYHNRLVEQNRLLIEKKALLTALVDEKTKMIEDITLALITALENANRMNDTDTGDHIKRVSEYAGIIAEEYTGDADFAGQVKLYSSLHDVGKVGIPDVLLKKPGAYTPEEQEQMKQHVLFGAKMLDSPGIPQLAVNIARYHHEKWDGSGYLEGLSGTDIPLEARIVTLADVYDALGTKRVYKEAFFEARIDDIIRDGSGKHFDPDLVEVFFRVKPAILAVKDTF